MAITPNQMTKGNILIVDDTPENLHLLSSALTEQGYEVRGVINGEMALRVAHSAPPDLILLDIKMPEISGYEVCRQLKAVEQTREIPVIFLSILDETWDKVQAFAVGGADYITKPFEIEEVLARIGNQLSLQMAKAEIRQLNAELEQRVQQRTAQLEAANQVLTREIAQRQQAEALLQQQIAQKELMTGILQRIHQSLNLDSILNTTVAEVQQFLQADRVLIYRFEPDWSGVVVVESVTNPTLSILGTTVKDHCFNERYVRQYQQGRTHNVADIYTAGLSPCHINMLAALHIRANLVVPIVQEELLWGLLSVNHCTQPRQWSPLEIDLLKQLATQVAIALKQSALYQQVQQLNVNLEQQVQERTAQLYQARKFDALLKRITDKVRDNLDESQILQTVVRELALGLDVASCTSALYDLERQTATIRYEYTTLVAKNQGKVQPMADFPEIYQQLLHHQCFQFCKFHSSGGWFTLLACPILDDQGVLGDLWITRPQVSVFPEQEIQLVQQVANQCAIAIRQARLYAAAQSQVEVLEHLHQMKDDFLSTVSHELRSPITNMKMAIQMLKLTAHRTEAIPVESHRIATRTPGEDTTQTIKAPDMTPIDPTQKYLQILDSECEREINLINDLLDLQRLESSAQSLDVEPIDLIPWLVSFIAPFKERTQKRQQSLHIELPEALPPIISNRDALERILAELLQNACKYTPPTEGIVLYVGVKQDQLRLQVTNSGVEIPPHDLPHLFEKFYRVATTDRWKQGGTGLGLALVKSLVEHLGGTIAISYTNGQITFTVEMPVCPQVVRLDDVGV